MDAKEAIEYFKEVEFIDKWGPDEAGNGDSLIKQANDARLTAISALEKVETLEAENARVRERETPKEHGPVSWNIDRWSIHCPSCGAEIDDDSDFCKWCGQAIKIDKE